jgi:hypothetical protein
MRHHNRHPTIAGQGPGGFDIGPLTPGGLSIAAMEPSYLAREDFVEFAEGQPVPDPTTARRAFDTLVRRYVMPDSRGAPELVRTHGLVIVDRTEVGFVPADQLEGFHAFNDQTRGYANLAIGAVSLRGLVQAFRPKDITLPVGMGKKIFGFLEVFTDDLVARQLPPAAGPS